MKPRFRYWGGWWVCVALDLHGGYRVFLFDAGKMALLIRNYRLGGCPITAKGCFRYCNAWCTTTAKSVGEIYWQHHVKLPEMEWRNR